MWKINPLNNIIKILIITREEVGFSISPEAERSLNFNWKMTYILNSGQLQYHYKRERSHLNFDL